MMKKPSSILYVPLYSNYLVGSSAMGIEYINEYKYKVTYKYESKLIEFYFNQKTLLNFLFD